MVDTLDNDEHYLNEFVENQQTNKNQEKGEKKTKIKSKTKAKRKFGSFSDLIETFRVHYRNLKSQYEMEEILSIFSGKVAANCPSNNSTKVDQYLNELISSNQWSNKSELKSAPMVLIVCQSALRCIELGKILKSSSSEKKFDFHYLFAKHKKLTEQIEYLRQEKSSFNIVLATPKRLDDILDKKVLNLKRLKFVLIDWNYENVKQQRLIDLNQLKTEICHLLCEQKSLSNRFLREKTKIGLF